MKNRLTKRQKDHSADIQKPAAKHSLLRQWLMLTVLAVIFTTAGSLVLGTGSAAPAGTLITLHRLNNGQTHMYTTSASEVQTVAPAGFREEPSYQFLDEGTSGPAVYGLVKGTSHFLTENTTEYAVAQTPKWGYRGEGIRFHAAALATAPQGYCRQNWYRLRNSVGHLYTPSKAEADLAVAQKGYALESTDAFTLDTPCPAPKPAALSPASMPKPVNVVSCSPVPASPTEQICNGTCPVGTIGHQNPVNHFYFCFKPAPAKASAPSSPYCKGGEAFGACVDPPGHNCGASAQWKYKGAKGCGAFTGGSASTAASPKPTGCGPAGFAATPSWCKCNSYTNNNTGVYRLRPGLRTDFEQICNDQPVGNVNCYTPGQTVPIEGGTRCLFWPQADCKLPYTDYWSTKYHGPLCQNLTSGTTVNLRNAVI